jgi:hypothetical protein
MHFMTAKNRPPQRPFPCDVRQWKVLDIAIDEVSGALYMHAAPQAIRIVYGTHRSDSPALLCGFLVVL